MDAAGISAPSRAQIQAGVSAMLSVGGNSGAPHGSADPRKAAATTKAGKPPGLPPVCARCQGYHLTSGCKAAITCGVCASGHYTSQCIALLKAGQTVPRRCANCGESGHSAPSYFCPVRVGKAEAKTSRKPKKTRRRRRKRKTHSADGVSAEAGQKPPESHASEEETPVEMKTPPSSQASPLVGTSPALLPLTEMDIADVESIKQVRYFIQAHVSFWKYMRVQAKRPHYSIEVMTHTLDSEPPPPPGLKWGCVTHSLGSGSLADVLALYNYTMKRSIEKSGVGPTSGDAMFEKYGQFLKDPSIPHIPFDSLEKGAKYVDQFPN